MRPLIGLLLISCLTPIYATVHQHPGRTLGGERWVTVLGPEDDAETLSRLLAAKGFRVARRIPGMLESNVITPYVITTDGVCGGSFITPTVRMQVLEATYREVVFESDTTNPNLCPENFFRASVDALDKVWAAPKPE